MLSSNHPGGAVRLCAVNQSGGELERRPEAAGVPYVRGQRQVEFDEVVDWPQLLEWVRGRRVVLGGLALIVAQLIWKSFFLGHFYFWQDDFHFMELALRNSFSWGYLTFAEAGHPLPGALAIAWAVARISLYSWPLASAITVIMLAGAGLAALRLLRTLFGNRPAILIPLAVYLLSPLTLPDIRWWSSAIETLPLQIATFMALNAQVNYVRTRRLRHAVAVAAWLLFGLVFFEKTLILPLFLLGVTSGFLMDGPWPGAIRRSLVSYWRGWALQLAVLVAYIVVLVVSPHSSGVREGVPGTSAGVFTFVTEIVKNTFVPGAIGGPWQWSASADAQYAYSAPPTALTWLALIVAAGIIGASVWSRIYAWRAWAILAGWLAAADIVPVLLGRITELGPKVLGFETRYVADAVPILVICLGLAFWPAAGRSDAASRRWAVSGVSHTGRMVAAGVVGAFVIGSVWSAQAFQNVTSSAQDRVFIANARTAVAEAPAGTVIADQPVPSSVMLGIFGTDAYASRLVQPMESAASAARIRWTARPDGTIDNLLVFAADGRLHQAAVFGQASVPLAFGQSCQPVSQGSVVVRFPAPAGGDNQVLHIAYIASPQWNGDYATVSYGNSSYLLFARQGLHSAYFTVHGSANSVTVSGPAVAGLCIGAMQVGVVVPSSSGPVIPATY
jgi:hypothetical protein